MSGAGGSTVLVVDDDPDICEVTQLTLEAQGYRVLTAGDGTEALALLQRGERPSLILLDLMMPQMSGAEFRAEQLADPKLARLPVVVLTGDGHAVDKAQALGLEGLAKPVDLDTLLGIVRRFCG